MWTNKQPLRALALGIPETKEKAWAVQPWLERVRPVTGTPLVFYPSAHRLLHVSFLSVPTPVQWEDKTGNCYGPSQCIRLDLPRIENWLVVQLGLKPRPSISLWFSLSHITCNLHVISCSVDIYRLPSALQG